MSQQPESAESTRQETPTRRLGAPILWWGLAGAWLGLGVLDSALTGGRGGPLGSWVQLSIALILLGPYLPHLFFDENGQEYAAKGMWSAARRHWSGVVGLLLMLAGVGLIVANLLMAPETLRPSDWAFAVVFLLMPAVSLAGLWGPRARLPIGALVAVLTVAAVLLSGIILYGSRLQWVYAQLNALIIGTIAILAVLAFGVLRLMDWIIARSGRAEG